LIAAQGCGVQWAGLIKQQQRVPSDGQGDNSDGIAITENNVHQRRQDRDNNRIGSQCNATTTMTMTTKGVANQEEEDTPQGGKTREEGQGKEEGSASAKEVHRAAAQGDNGDTVFLLMVEAKVATATASSSTVV
jgi:hypothetical protein